MTTKTSSSRRKEWLERVPSVQQGDPHFAFRSVAHRWVDQNPNSRENVMRTCLQTLLGKPFIKVRPSFLRNPETRRCLEIDAYCEELRLGAEFDGVQHRVFPNPFHSTRAQFERQQKRDQLKLALCKAHGVQLIIVSHHVQKEDIELHVKEQLILMGFLDSGHGPGTQAARTGGEDESEFDETWLSFLELQIAAV